MELKEQAVKVSLSLRAKLSLAIVAVLLFSIGLNTTLNYLNFEKRLTETSDSTYQIVVEETQNDIQQAINLGLPLASINNIQSLLDRRIQLVSGITSLSVVDMNNQVLFSTGEIEPDNREISLPITNTFGLNEGKLQLHYSPKALYESQLALLEKQILYATIWVTGCALFGFIILRFFLNNILTRINTARSASEQFQTNGANVFNIFEETQEAFNAQQTQHKRKIRTKHYPFFIITLAIVLTIVANFGASYQSLHAFSKVYEPKLEQKSHLIGDALSTMIDRLVDNGVPIERLNGLESEFAFYVDRHEELLAISLNQNKDSIYTYSPGSSTEDLKQTSSLVLSPDSAIELKIATDGNIIGNILEDSLMDMITVLITSCLVVTEIILFLCQYMILSPLQQIKRLLSKDNLTVGLHTAAIRSKDEISALTQNINNLVSSAAKSKKTTLLDNQDYRFIRLPLFLLVFAEAASLAFFPHYVSNLDSMSNIIPQSLITSLPISLFMLCWAISLPFAGYWSDKVGRRFSLMTGGIITAIGLTITAFVTNIEILLLTRAITAVGYGIVFISAQGYVSDTTTDKNRTKGMATFLSSFFSGSLCGAAIGGILADKLGYAPTFILSGLLALLGVLLIASFFESKQSETVGQPVKLQDFKILLKNKYFALITLFSAIPAKIILTGFLYYICPVYLQDMGESSSVSGRVIMTYGLAIILIAPISAALVDKFKNKIAFIVLGGLISSIAMLNVYFLDGTSGVLLIVIFVGIAHGICVSPQIPLVIDLMSNQGIERGKIIGIFRLTERIGNITGPILAGILLSTFSYNETIIIFGVILFISSIILLFSYTVFTRMDKRVAEA
ncbi:MFS transporter [Vibrio sp.]|nr:MFS transporter [Vibrio sp.]